MKIHRQLFMYETAGYPADSMLGTAVKSTIWQTKQVRVGQLVITYKIFGNVIPEADDPFSKRNPASSIFMNPVTKVIVAAMSVLQDPPCAYPCRIPAVLVQFPDKTKILYKDRTFEEVCAQYIWV